MSIIHNLTLAASMLLPCIAVLAQTPPPEVPGGTVRMIVPLPAGGPSDFIARQTAQHLAAALGQAVVVENKPGANGLLAAREVAAAGSDGRTLLYAPGSMIAAPLLVKGAAFDWRRELAPLGKVARVPFGLAVHPGIGADTVEELVARARARPGELNVATNTPSEVMATAQFMQAAGVTLTRVPYRGAPQSLPDLLAGRVHLMFGPLAAFRPHVESGALRLLAVLGPERSPALPGVPTMAEAGLPGVSVPTWQALYVSARVDVERRDRLARGVTDAALRPEARTALQGRLLAVETASPQELAATIAHELGAWTTLIDEYRLAAE